MGSGWSSGSSWVPPARGWCLVLCVLVLCATWSRASDSESADGPRIEIPSPSRPDGLKTHVWSLWQSTETLVTRLDERVDDSQSSKDNLQKVKAEAAKLRTDLEAWKRSSLAALRESKTLRKDLREIERLLVVSETKLAAYTSSSEGSLMIAQATILTREREARTWRTVGILALVAGAIGWLVAFLT